MAFWCPLVIFPTLIIWDLCDTQVFVKPGVFNLPCQPKNNVMYLKVYKTGSTTLQNMFYRYAFHNNLRIVPVRTDPILYKLKNHLISRKFLEDNQLPQTYNIFAEHLYDYNEHGISTLMPRDTVFVGSLREPIKQFQGMIKEFGFTNNSWRLKTLGLNLSDPVRDLLSKKDNYPKDLWIPYFLYNTMSHHFGLVHINGTERNFEKRIFKIKQHFALVALLEYFDEGLVLLRRLLCWNHRDIIYTALRQRQHGEYEEIDHALEHKRHNIMDYKLYNVFAQELMLKLSQQDIEFWEELQHFRNLNKKVNKFCHKVYKVYSNRSSVVDNKRSFLKIRTSNWSEGFAVSNMDCLLMKLDNRVFRNALLVKQMPQLCKNRSKSLGAKNDFIKLEDGRFLPSHVYCNDNGIVNMADLLASNFDLLAT